MLDRESPPAERICMSCQEHDGSYRCKDCFGKNWFCKNCCIKDHAQHPFHRVQTWTGDHFTTTALKDLGLVLYLGHNGHPCPSQQNHLHSDISFSTSSTSSSISNLTIVDKSGVFEHNVQWCLCPNRQSHDIILFRMGLFSASIYTPQTAFTFQCLDYFHIDSMECRTSAGNFYKKLRRLTNEIFPDEVKVSKYPTDYYYIFTQLNIGSIPRVDAYLQAMASSSGLEKVRLWPRYR
jgi:hypothetical protein